MSKLNICANCRHWHAYIDEPEDGEEQQGRCRRHAPQVVMNTEGLVIAGFGWIDSTEETRWPETEADDHCGEHEGKEIPLQTPQPGV